jgi:dipeptidyl aminopeptidase/acylaminoacyl peptidase
MLRKIIPLLTVLLYSTLYGQQAPGVLRVETIMQDPRWIGTSPDHISWGADGKTILFTWNPEKAPADSLYKVSVRNIVPQKLSPAEKNKLVTQDIMEHNTHRSAVTWSLDGDIYYQNNGGKIVRVTQSPETESSPAFSFNDTKLVYTRQNNLFAWDIASGTMEQLTQFVPGSGSPKEAKPTREEAWLKNDQLAYMQVLKERKDKKEAAEDYDKLHGIKKLRSIGLEGKTVANLQISPDGRFVTYNLFSPATAKGTIVPAFVTESGYTTDLNGRTKVGQPQGTSAFYLYDRKKDTIYEVQTYQIPGIRDVPAYLKDYPAAFQKLQKDSAARTVTVSGISWAPGSKNGIVEIRARDNKDRWIMLLDPENGKLTLADRQHDDAWISGPGIFRNLGWIDRENLWFQSEETGYSHIYIYNITRRQKRAVTRGAFEVQQARLSNDGKSFYIISNESDPGEKQWWQVQISSGKRQKITNLPGANEVIISPDEKYIAFRNSTTDHPWELYIQENKPGALAKRITNASRSAAFNQFHWRAPELIQFPASDGASVYARIYKPENPKPGMPAVLFVHGAGYLQNAHKWWSSYFREYMFNNLLADNGYYVMDIDYRGSAGYGRDWRTGIYRHMGGKDLSDHVDAVKFLVKNFQVDPAKIGLYGGSYGGFITLMALFTKPEVFKSGAALRPVTDWANYNHGYTSNILNEPFTDSLAYRRSSPIYFADGLKGSLLICHGMMDVNVHYQDAVKLSQRLIELGKDNWELASYPLEDHGFIEPSSWTDEYKRIFKLFERTLKK